MSEKIALIQNTLNPYHPASFYENMLKYSSNPLNYDISYNYNINNYNTKNHNIKQAYDTINKYRIIRNSAINTNFNNVYNSQELKKNKKLEISKSMDKITKQNKYSYNSKSIDNINKEIIKFKNKMHKDKEYLNYIQNKLITQNDNDIKNEKRRAYSLTNRNNYDKKYMNIKNINYELNDYFTEKRKIKNIIINNNNFVDNNIIYNKNLINNYQKDNFSNKKTDNINNINNINSNNFIFKRNNSFFMTNNNIVNRLILNKNIDKNNYLEEDKINYQKENIIDNNNENIMKNNMNINDYEYIKYPERKSFQKQIDFSNMKYLTINIKNDKIQLKDKEIKLNDISNLTKPDKDIIKDKKILNRYQTKKFDKYVNNIINENNKENNDKNIKISLNSNDILTNYENIKKKYDKEKNMINELSSYGNYYRKRSGTCIKEDRKEQKNVKMTNQNINLKNMNNMNSLKNRKASDALNTMNIKYFEDIDFNKIKSKYSDSLKNNKIKYNNDNALNKSNINKYNFNTISAFSLNIEKNENNNKDLLIKNLNQKIIDLVKQLKVANCKINNLSEIIEEMKNKNNNKFNNKVLFIDKLISFNYISNKNNYIKLNHQNSNNKNKNKIKTHKINITKLNIHNKNEKINISNISNLSRNSFKYINTTSENEHYSYSSFDNYNNLNLYFRKITSTIVNDKKINKYKKTKPSLSLTKSSIKKNINTLPNIIKTLNNKSISNTNNISNNSSIKDIQITDKTIYTLHSLQTNNDNLKIIIFDPDSKKFYTQKVPDNHNFLENFTKKHNNSKNEEGKINNCEVFLFTEGGYLYIITGENYDLFYKLDINKKEISKLCNLKCNHPNGNMIYYDQRIFCLSGDNNKKVECYIESKNEWIEIPEMLIERSNFSTCIIKEQYLFALFGYNNNTQQYLNTIEFIDLLCENAKWKYLSYENINNSSLFFIGSLAINFDDKKIIILGGYDGNEKRYNNNFYQIILKKNFDKENYNISDEKLSEIIKIENNNNLNLNDMDNDWNGHSGDEVENQCCFFNMGYNRYYGENDNIFYVAFDKELNAHLINVDGFSHEIFNFH